MKSVEYEITFELKGVKGNKLIAEASIVLNNLISASKRDGFGRFDLIGRDNEVVGEAFITPIDTVNKK